MLNINFVPDDYIQSNESHRTNLMYLALFAIVMAALGGVFITIEIRQRACNEKERLVNEKTAQARGAIKQFEELQSRRRDLMKTVITTAELLEPVPRSVLLASLTNNLPTGMSLLKLKFVQEEPKHVKHATSTNKYQEAQAKKEGATVVEISPEKMLETHMNIEGIAPSDLQVAAYIERLGSSNLLDNVALVESKEYKTGTKTTGDTTFRQFKLTAILRKDIHPTKEDVEKIRAKHENGVHGF